MNNLVGAMVAVALAAGCGGARGELAAPPNALAIERDFTSWMVAWQDALRRRDGQAYADMFAPESVSIGPAFDDVGVGPTPARVTTAAGEINPVPSIAPDGRSAWSVEVGPALRRTVLAERAEVGWRLLFAHSSRGVPSDEARRHEEAGDWPALADIGDAVPDDAQSLAQLLSHALGGADVFAAAISKRPGTTAIGPAPGDHFTGTHDVSEYVRSLFARPGARVVRSGGMRGGIAAGRDVGWIATNVDLVVQRGPRDLARPCRLTAVFVREGEGWAVVQLHLSHAVPE
jgi:hypothetical protein